MAAASANATPAPESEALAAEKAAILARYDAAPNRKERLALQAQFDQRLLHLNDRLAFFGPAGS